ncbi:undecaprenyl-phosphate glucose phosphotransferase [Psychromonas sp. RZ22]|uniref:undecaprenyl-phosphate glucose phosphotransferase n=1 Tax=Psychromonas algarum TaxID=2555643 RepID=UPI0010673A4D|nr:undecaprenyl-phosphate glucose phosphotransferase [Psychromonas sp. RZ22]TEW56151.1 undecaprenyl-phosphate glucose phosphotransferase [Psychromonas sp. RZ22]
MEDFYVKNNSCPYSIILRIADIFFILSMLLSVIYLYNETFTILYFLVGLIAVISFSLSAETMNLYRSWRTGFPAQLFTYTLFSWLSAVFIISIFLFFSKFSLELSRVVIGFWFVSSTIALIGWRIVFRLILFKRRCQGFNTQKIAIIGLTPSGVRLANEFYQHPEIGFTLNGFFDDRNDGRVSSEFITQLEGDIKKGIDLAKAGNFDIVYIALPLAAQKRIELILQGLGNTTVDVHIVPDFFTFNLMNAHLSQVGGTQTISVYESPMNGLSYFSKRIEDIIGASLILSIITLPMLIIAILIKLDSPGSVFFKQTRYGLSGKPINVWKFRSMTAVDNGDVIKQATKGDSRVTKLGAFLRRTSLDELPQFINVLQGQMSIVGPRPHAVAHNEEYRNLVTFYMLRHKVKPGITGWAQINGWRGETDTLDKMKGRIEFDLQYIRNWSILFDLKIVFLTLFKGFIHKNAY